MTTAYSPDGQGNTGYCGFEVGQHVACVRDKWRAAENPPAHSPVRGRVYVVRKIIAIDKVVGLYFEELLNAHRYTPNGYMEQAWNALCFRPLPKLTVDTFVSADAPVEGVSA